MRAMHRGTFVRALGERARMKGSKHRTRGRPSLPWRCTTGRAGARDALRDKPAAGRGPGAAFSLRQRPERERYDGPRAGAAKLAADHRQRPT